MRLNRCLAITIPGLLLALYGPMVHANGASDKTLAGDVLGALQNDASLAQAVGGIEVTAENGDVTLHGTVASEEDRAAINQKAATVSGVAQVLDELNVVGTVSAAASTAL